MNKERNKGARESGSLINDQDVESSLYQLLSFINCKVCNNLARVDQGESRKTCSTRPPVEQQGAEREREKKEVHAFNLFTSSALQTSLISAAI